MPHCHIKFLLVTLFQSGYFHYCASKSWEIAAIQNTRRRSLCDERLIWRCLCLVTQPLSSQCMSVPCEKSRRTEKVNKAEIFYVQSPNKKLKILILFWGNVLVFSWKSTARPFLGSSLENVMLSQFLSRALVRDQCCQNSWFITNPAILGLTLVTKFSAREKSRKP